MSDNAYEFETIARKVFQCGRGDDPFGILSDADFWTSLSHDEFDKRSAFMAWAVLLRLRNKYLDSVDGRSKYYIASRKLEKRVISAKSNIEIIGVLREIEKIVEDLDIGEFPHLSYSPTNDKR